MSRVLYWRVGGLGDTLLNLLPATWLGEMFGPVTMAVDRRWREGVGLFGVATLDEAFLSEALFGSRPDVLAKAFAPYDLIVAVRADGDGSMGGRLAEAAAHARIVVVPPLPPADAALPYPHWLASQIGAALTATPPDPLSLPTPTARWRGGHELLLIPGSGGREKRMSPDIVASVAGWGKERGLTTTLLVGPVEIESALPLPDLPTLVSPPLPELAQRIAGAARVVGADSGPTHLAALLGAPTVALFGPSDPAVWRPFGPRAAWRANPTAKEIGRRLADGW